MNLIRVGSHFVNLDLVSRITDLSSRDSGGQTIQGLLRIEFDGGQDVEIAQDALAVLAWLDQRSTRLPPPLIP